MNRRFHRRAPAPRARCMAVFAVVAIACLLSPGTASAQVPPGFPTTPPAPMGERPIAFPPFTETELPNGLRVVVVPYGTQPVMSARLYMPGGSAADPSGLAGVAELTALSLTRGTETRTAEEISAAIEGVGGSLAASASSDFFTISLTTLADDASTGFELLGDVVLRASFPPGEVELGRTQLLSALQAEQGQPASIASRHLAAQLYGPDHPYGVDATPETMEAVERTRVLEYRDRVVRPRGALLLVAGRVDEEAVLALAREHLGGWQGDAAPGFDYPVTAPPGGTRIRLVHRPASVQSVLALGTTTTRPDDPDVFPLITLSWIFGGGSDARLHRILREDKGWTYGAFSQVTRPAGTGSMRISAEVRTEVTDSALVEVIHQLDRLRSEPIPDAELKSAQGFLAGSFPLRLETPDQVAGQLAGNLLLGLPLEDVTEFPERIRDVTLDDVTRVARRFVDPDRTVVVVVGDGRRILEGLEAIGPVDLVDIEGIPLDRAELLAPGVAPSWDASRLEAGIRRYEVFVQDTPMGAAEYRLERDGDAWVSTSIISSPAGSQESRLRFGVEDFAPLSIEQEAPVGPGRIQVNLRVEEGRLTGTIQLPAQLGGDREVDDPIAPGVLFPGMDEYALQLSELSEGARIRIPHLDLVEGTTTLLEARVTGREAVRVHAGEFESWRVELIGGQVPMILNLRVDAPHILIRQEYRGQPVRFELTALGPLEP
jgi:zinc protease